MKRRIFPILALALCFLFGSLAGTGMQTASAEDAAVRSVTAIGTDNAQLALPASYEQYLPLSRATDVAVSEKYLAVADANRIYLYDRSVAGSEYRVYTHGSESTTVSKMQFSESGLLYFADSTLNLYTLDVAAETLDASRPLYSLSTFVLVGSTLYVASNSDAGTEMRALAADGSTDIQSADVFGNFSARPCLSYYGGTLFCAVGNAVYPYDGATLSSGTPFFLGESAISPQSVCVTENAIFYTDPEGLHACDLRGDNAVLLEAGSGSSALSAFGNRLYYVQNTRIREYDLLENAFTGYEIAAASSSQNRLSSACEAVRNDTLLVTADAGNNRVSVYDLAQKTFTLIPCTDASGAPVRPEHVAVDKSGERIAYCSGSTISVYALNGGTGEYELSYRNTAPAAVTGLCFVFDECRYITSNNGFGVTDEAGGAVTPVYFETPIAAIAADLYGAVYLAFTSGTVRVFSGEELASAAPQGEVCEYTLPSGFSSVRADFDGNLYCLASGGIYKNGTLFATLSSFVYHAEGEEAHAPVSFALGFKDDCLFVQYGNYIVRTNAGALDIPSLEKITVGGAADQAFTVHEAEGVLVDIAAGVVGIRIDLDALRAAQSPYFSYLTYGPMQEAQRGILLGKTSRFALVVLVEDGAAYAALFPLEDAISPDAAEYLSEAEGTRYLTNDVSAYFAPVLHGALADSRLARAQRVTLLSTIETESGTFACVSYQTEARSEGTGYLPLAYLTEICPVREEGEAYFNAYLKTGAEGVLFTAESGETLLVQERTAARFYDNGDGTYTARITKDGTVYAATVGEDAVDFNESDALRISLIVILTVLAILIIGIYLYLLPRKAYKN